MRDLRDAASGDLSSDDRLTEMVGVPLCDCGSLDPFNNLIEEDRRWVSRPSGDRICRGCGRPYVEKIVGETRP